MLVEISSAYDISVESNFLRYRKIEHQTEGSPRNELRTHELP
jgi:hypothetical protein